MAENQRVENESLAPELVLEPNSVGAPADNESEQAPPTEVPAQTAENLGAFTSLSTDEVSLIIFLRCHSIRSQAIGRILVLERTRDRRHEVAATAAVRAKLNHLKNKPPISTEAARNAVAVITDRAIPGYHWHLTQARAWHAEVNGVPVAGIGARAAAKMRMELKKFRYKMLRDPKSLKASAFPAIRAETKAKEEFFQQYGYLEGDKQGLTSFLSRKLPQLVPIAADEQQ